MAKQTKQVNPVIAPSHLQGKKNLSGIKRCREGREGWIVYAIPNSIYTHIEFFLWITRNNNNNNKTSIVKSRNHTSKEMAISQRIS